MNLNKGEKKKIVHSTDWQNGVIVYVRVNVLTVNHFESLCLPVSLM